MDEATMKFNSQVLEINPECYLKAIEYVSVMIDELIELFKDVDKT